MKSKLEDAILGTVSARSEMMQRRKQLAAAGDARCYSVTVTPHLSCHSHSYHVIVIHTATLSSHTATLSFVS